MSPQKVLKLQNWHVQGAEAQLGLVDSQMGVPGASAAPILWKFRQYPQCFTASWSQNIYSKTGIEKTVQSVCC